MNNKKNKSSHNPSLSLTAFIIITVVYIICDYQNTLGSAPTQLKFTMAYLAFILVIEFIINSYLFYYAPKDAPVGSTVKSSTINSAVLAGCINT